MEVQHAWIPVSNDNGKHSNFAIRYSRHNIVNHESGFRTRVKMYWVSSGIEQNVISVSANVTQLAKSRIAGNA